MISEVRMRSDDCYHSRSLPGGSRAAEIVSCEGGRRESK
jgi:hypothetical protein